MKSYAEAITLSHKITLPTAEDDPAFGMIELFMRGEKTGWFNPLLNIYASSGDVAKAFELSERKKLIEVSWFFTGLSISTREGRVDEPIRALRVKRKTMELLQRDILEEFAAGRQRSMERIESLGTLFRAGMAEIETGTSALQGNAFSMAH